MKYDIFDKQAA